MSIWVIWEILVYRHFFRKLNKPNMPNIKIEPRDRHFTRNAMQGSFNDAELNIETAVNSSPEPEVA